MAKKLMCWRKRRGMSVWDSTSLDGGIVEVFKNSKTKKHSVVFVPTTGRDKFIKSSTTKPKAISSAHSYMKKNNKC